MISLSPDLELDDFHVYRYAGKPVVSVTQVLRSEGLIDDRFFPQDDAARRRGTIVHRLAELDVENDLDEEGVPTDFRGYLAAIRAFKLETGWTTELHEGKPLAEVRMFDKGLGAAGTADEIGRMAGGGGLRLLDWKTGEPAPATGLQLAAYARLWYLATGKPIALRIACELREDGTYRIHRYTNVEDLTTFTSALRVNRWRRDHLAGLAEARSAA